MTPETLIKGTYEITVAYKYFVAFATNRLNWTAESGLDPVELVMQNFKENNSAIMNDFISSEIRKEAVAQAQPQIEAMAEYIDSASKTSYEIVV